MLDLQLLNWYSNSMLARQTLEIILQNSKELKQVRRLVKSLHYIYDCIAKRDKKVYLYVTKTYLSFTTDFTETKTTDSYPAICTLRKSHIIKTDGLNNPFDNKRNDEGYLYLIDAQSIIKFLNSHVEPDIIHMSIVLPIPQVENQMAEMTLAYETVDGVQADFTLYTNIQNSEGWPFLGGRINDQSYLFKNSQSFKFITFPPKFSKKIDYIKKYPDFWLCLSPNGINLQRPENGHIVSDQCIKPQSSLQYNHFELEEYLRGNNYLGVKTAPFFHHLEISNKEGKKCTARLITVKNLLHDNMEKCYLVMETFTDKKQISQAFQIYPTRSIDFSHTQTSRTQKIAPRMINREPKKEEDGLDERVIINKFYGLQYEEELNEHMTMREGFISASNQVKIQPEQKKYKIELD